MCAKHLEKHFLAICLLVQNFSPLSLLNSWHLPRVTYICLLWELRTSLHQWAWTKTLEGRTQPRALLQEHQELFGSLGRDTVSCCAVGTWALTLWSRIEQLKPGQKKTWHILSSLEGIWPSSLRWGEWEISIVSQVRKWGWKSPHPWNAGGNVWCSFPHSHMAFIKLFADPLQQETGF